MSCIAGIINLDGAPVERALLGRMTGAMKSRAPDASDLWCSGAVGLGHAMLRISPESARERQPCTLDGHAWITADARLDGRDELVGRLRAAGRDVANDAPDPELLLHAYGAFGEEMPAHIIGDFAFALWDERGRKLVCARDHFGVRPFFYARTERAFVFASDIDALLLHPGIAASLDEEAVGDFMLFGLYQGPASSIYRDVRRLPAASCIGLDREGFRMREYWRLAPPDPVRRGGNRECVEEFRSLFDLAVGDRLRAGNVILELSGGMDSGAIASVAAARARDNRCALAAFTVTTNHFFADDEEGRYAAMAASQLSIPLALRELGEHRLFERYGAPELKTAEPSSIPHRAFSFDTMAQASASGARVLLSGQGGDEALGTSTAYLAGLLRRGRVGEFSAEVLVHVRGTGSLRGMGLRSIMTGLLGWRQRRPAIPRWRPPFPDWLDEGFVVRTGLRERWEAAWTRMLEASEPDQLLREWASSQALAGYEMFGLPMVARHPFFDLRLVHFLLAAPNSMKTGKKLLREAMRGGLPDPILARPKRPAAGDAARAALARNLVSAPMASSLSLVGGRYINSGRYLRALERYLGGEGIESTWATIPMLAPVCLNFWLSQHSG